MIIIAGNLMSWKEALKEGQELVLATSSKNGKPNANVVISNGLFDDKILISNCQMKTSIENIRENDNVCIIAKIKKEYYRIRGLAKSYSSGKYFDVAIKKATPEYPVKTAITVDIKEVFDLDKGKILFKS